MSHCSSCSPTPADLIACLFGGDAAACRRVYFARYICPLVCRIMDIPLYLQPWPIDPNPPDPPWRDILDLTTLLVTNQVFDPVDPQRMRKMKIDMLTDFRKGLEEVIKELDREIQTSVPGRK